MLHVKTRYWGVLFALPALFVYVGLVPGSAFAVTFDVYLIASHSAPVSSASAPFTVETSTVYALGNLNGNLRATTATLVENFTLNVEAALSYNNYRDLDLTKPTDPGEAGAGSAVLINSEVSIWDDVGITSAGGDGADEEFDAGMNIDFGRNSRVVFNPMAGGFTDLVLAEDGGLNPFSLDLCASADCTTYDRIFNGFKRGFLTELPDFAINDSDVASEMDQVFLFRFSETVFDYVRVIEHDDRNVYTNQRLEVDFLGVGSAPGLDPVGLPGDYNGDGETNLADYTVWRNSLSAMINPYSGADASGDGEIGQADYELWKLHFGAIHEVAGTVVVPEPLASMLMVLSLAVVNHHLHLQRKFKGIRTRMTTPDLHPVSSSTAN